jgi:hypothetical protein
LRASKERDDGGFELLLREIAGRGPVILAEAIDDGISGDPEPVGENLSRVP